jgi:O-antigen/teichoic acid export membrane protein
VIKAKRAALGAATGILDQGARVIVALIVTPILVSALGAAGFGIWQILFRLHSQLAPLDGRSPEVLKWEVSNSQDADHRILQSHVGAAIFSMLIYLPLLVTAYLLTYLLMPHYIEVQGTELRLARYAAIILGLTTIFLTLSQLFEAVVRGMNLAYKLFGIKIGLVICAGVMTAAVAQLGYGLAWIALSQLVVAIIGLPLFYMAAKKNVEWLGFRRPSGKELLSFVNRCKWFMTWEAISLWMLAGEIVVLGAFVKSEVVSVYVLTLFASQMATVAVITGILAILPGLGGLIGTGSFHKATLVHQESTNYRRLICISICCVVLTFNNAFVTLWVGSEFYAGNVVNLLTVIVTLQLVSIRHEATVLNIALDIKAKVVLGLMSILLSLSFLLWLVPKYELKGFCLALILGRLLLTVSYPILVAKFLRQSIFENFNTWKSLVSILCLLLCWKLSDLVIISSWTELLAESSFLGMWIFLLLYFFTFDENQKRLLYQRCRSIIGHQ